MPTDQTRRYFADSTASYALAFIALLEYARRHRGKEHEFEFGPPDLGSMVAEGLFISGQHLSELASVLAGVEGLAEAEPGAEEQQALARLPTHGRVGGTRGAGR